MGYATIPHLLGGSSYFCYAVHNQSSFSSPFCLMEPLPFHGLSVYGSKKMEVIRSPFTTSTSPAVAHPQPPTWRPAGWYDPIWSTIECPTDLASVQSWRVSQPKDFLFAMQKNCTSTWAGLKMYSLLKMGIFQPAMLDYWRVNEWLVGGF